MIGVLLVDDQELVRSGFRLIVELQDDMAVVGEASNGREAVELARAHRPDVVLMDVRMPVLDGIAATRAIAHASPEAHVLVLTTFDLDEYVYDSVKAGASGFLLKDAGREQLIHAIRTVAAGDSLLAPAVTRRLIERFSRLPRPGDSPTELRRTERARARGAPGSRPWPLERRDREVALRHRGHGEDARQPHPPEARSQRPGPGGGARVRDRARRARL